MSTAYVPRRPFASQFLTLRGLRHHVLVWGDLAQVSPARPLLVMLHGWMDVGASFQFVVDALHAQADERVVVAMDWRGFGLSDNSGADSYWFPDYLGDLDALLDQVSPTQPVDLLGHSMGGNIVMSFAAVRPERIRRLVNLEGFGLPDVPAEQAPDRLLSWLNELKAPAQLKAYASLDAVAERLLKTNPRLSADKAAWLAGHWSRQVGSEWHILGDPAHKRSNPVLYRKAEILAGWARIQAPTLWVEGARTNLSAFWGDRYPREDFESRLALVPQVQRLVVPDAGHMLHHDQPQALARGLMQFLRS